MQVIKPLLSGIDTLVLSFDAYWTSRTFFALLNAKLEEAKALKEEVPFCLVEPDGNAIQFMLKPHGAAGYAWLLIGNDYCLKIMDAVKPESRPNLIIEFRSEFLWSVGPLEAVTRIMDALECIGAELPIRKPSRVDLCKDLLVVEDGWTIDLLKYAVTKATIDDTHRKHQQMSGITFGRKALVARLYDKTREIREVSGKTWFHDLWGLEELPEGTLVLRVEFQLRRATLRELGCNDISTLFQALPNIWAYCTRDWLKFQDNPGEHHTKRNTLTWWREVQDSFYGLQEGEPLIRAKAMETDKKRLSQQATGIGTSLIAMDREEGKPGQAPCLEGYAKAMDEALERSGKSEKELEEDVVKKLLKRTRLTKEMESALAQRKRLGLSDLPREDKA